MKICVPIAMPDIARVKHQLDASSSLADMAEIRLDALEARPEPRELEALVQHSGIPLLFTCRRREEGGMFRQGEEERLSWLLQAVDAGASFVDIELSTDTALRDRLCIHARERECRVIMSWHDFGGTPGADEVSRVLNEQRAAGADIAKIVTMATSDSDVRRVLGLYCLSDDLGVPLIAFCMGEKGRLSRVACLAMGAFLTFASLDSGSETAPGQIPLEKFRELLDTVA